MSDPQTLVLVILALYVSECFWWVPRGAVVVCARGRSWRVVHPSAGMGNEHGGLVLLPLLPRANAAFQVSQWAISLTPTDTFAYVAQAINPAGRPLQQARRVAIADIQDVSRRGRDLLINGQLFLRGACDMSSFHYARLFDRLTQIPAANREHAIASALADSMDLTAAKSRLDYCLGQTRWLQVMCVGLFCLLIVLIPAILLFPTWGIYRWPCALLTVILQFEVIRRFYFSHRSLMPAATAYRWRSIATMILVPPAAVRACDFLSREVMAKFHPLTIAAVSCPAAEFRRIARSVLLDLHYPLRPVCPSSEPAEITIEIDFRSRLLSAIRTLVIRAGYDPEQLTQPPVPEDPSCLAYCPRCDMQFFVPFGICDSCGGIPLHPF